jgi:type I restriction enzyme M protein
MLSPRLRQEVDGLWKMFWASGLTNPLSSIEQITYLLFLKQLEVLDAERSKRRYSIYGARLNCPLAHSIDDALGEKPPLPPGADLATYKDYCKGHNSCRWSYIKQAQPTVDLRTSKTVTPHDHLSQYVFPWLRDLHTILAETAQIGTPPAVAGQNTETPVDENGMSAVIDAPMGDAYFQLPSEKSATLQSAIAIVDDLFKYVGRSSANSDIMGDIFEYLLEEIKSSGKNGQFRTPRHIIRFMIELLDPKEGERIVDPAAGTGGFLINSLQHIRKTHTDPESLVLEWDGTPHRVYGGSLDVEKYLKGIYFTGFENDRTMVRIGWMNMILHGIEKPKIILRDSLSKSLDDSESGAYAYALANPPYTGNVDKGDLHDAPRFPRNERNTKEPITDKSELLFVWLLLDLLTVGGRGAVIVPEGVLFGSTGAHRALRKELLMQHRLEAVISLPAGVFQPYTGVKTSILVFQTVGTQFVRGDEPTTETVWFYEVTSDGYSLDAKRNDKPEENDLWDAQEKFKRKSVESLSYFRPDIFTVRWRDVDEHTLKIFPNLTAEKDNAWGLHELFRELPRDPVEATEKITEEQRPKIHLMYADLIASERGKAAAVALSKTTEAQKQEAITKHYARHLKDIDRIFKRKTDELLESRFDTFGRNALKELRREENAVASALIESNVEQLTGLSGEELTALAESGNKDELAGVFHEDLNIAILIEDVVREFAKLDGYNVKLRTLEVREFKQALKESRSWSAPVRVWRLNDEWRNEDGSLEGSHNEEGRLRPEYVADESLYNSDGTVKAEYLDPLCIEHNDLNLAAGRYKPFNVMVEQLDSPKVIIEQLKALEGQMQERLDRLLALVENR